MTKKKKQTYAQTRRNYVGKMKMNPQLFEKYFGKKK